MIGALRAANADPASVFTGVGHAPEPLIDAEIAVGAPPTGAAACDLPDWLMEEFRASLGSEGEAAGMALRQRAPVMLRVNLRRNSREDAVHALAKDDITSTAHPIAKTAICVTEGARKLARSRAYLEGLVELQDGSGQSAMERIDLSGVASVLDYCAGGGGKSLALAARTDARIFAHDIDPARMQDLPDRAARCGVQITQIATSFLTGSAPFDIVLCDAPCSGSGTWRRTPEAKWRLTPERLMELTQIQSQILQDAAALVAPGGRLVYATCSLLAAENEARIDHFLGTVPGWTRCDLRRFDVSDGGDGFFVTQMRRA